MMQEMTYLERQAAFDNGKAPASTKELSTGLVLFYAKNEKRRPFRVEVKRIEKGARTRLMVVDIEPDNPHFIGIGNTKVRRARPLGLKAGVNHGRGAEFMVHVSQLRTPA